MKMVILLLLLAIGAVAEDWPAACGPKKREIRSDEKFDLKVDKSVTEAPVPADQAAVYFVSKTANSEAPPIMVALDGNGSAEVYWLDSSIM